ncbi:PQQ-binding-like beta-propeller repeat protein [Nocardia sp. NPDC058658]|uniref:outer membrane protein assembly factor BamB family protein n=1 Tax=Nocardia sp. NPDC058658 TaxID=3346580 RepID=UPI0036491818
MSDEPSIERAESTPSRLITVAGVAGAVLLLGGIAAALYSQFFAAPIPVPSDEPDSSQFPARIVWGTLIIGVVVAVISGFIIVRGRRPDPGADGATAAGVLALLLILTGAGVFTILEHIPSTYGRLTSTFVVTSRLPFAIAGLILVLGGAISIFTLASKPRALMMSRPVIAIGLSLGVVLCTSITGFALRAGNDGRNIDHVQARDISVPVVPATIGAEKFRISIPATRLRNAVITAGAGFVVSTEHGITAYDGATGAERWHYRRVSGAVRNLPQETRSFETERVVLTFWDNRGWMAFDSFTGEILWSESDFNRRPFEDRFGPIPGPLLITSSDTNELSRFDARTGRRLWTAPAAPKDCRSISSTEAIITTRIYRMFVCTGDSTTIEVTTWDPGSGSMTDRRTIAAPGARYLSPTRTVSFEDGFVSFSWSQDGGEHQLWLRPATDINIAEINRSRDDVVATGGSGGQILVDGRGATFDIVDIDGRNDPIALSGVSTILNPIFVADRIVGLGTIPDQYVVQTWNPATGAIDATVPIGPMPDIRDLRLIRAPGSLLVISPHRDTGTVDIIGLG